MIDGETIFGLIVIAVAVWVGWKLARAGIGAGRAFPRPPDHINGAPMTSVAMADGDRYVQASYDPHYRLSPEQLAAYAAEAARQEMYRRGQLPTFDGLGAVIDPAVGQQRRPIDNHPYDGGRY